MKVSLHSFFYNSITLYFQFWAKLVLKRWQPIIIAVIGSAGKTTAMTLIESVLIKHLSVKVSHKSNAASAIPLNILGLTQHSFSFSEWLKLIIYAPFKIFSIPKQKIYLCEMDTDRNGEMQLHSRLITPDICCWMSASPAHTQNFQGKDLMDIYQNMLNDMGQAAIVTRSLLLFNAQDQNILKILPSVKARFEAVSLDTKTPQALIYLKDHQISLAGTKITFVINNEKMETLLAKEVEFNEITLHFPITILSKINCYGLAMAIIIALSFGVNKKQLIEDLSEFVLPPGRLSLFAGKNASTIIDSSYNASKNAGIDALNVLVTIGNNRNLAILGDMRELGVFAQKEHEQLAQEIVKLRIGRVILIGTLMRDYVAPVLLANGYQLDKTLFLRTPKQAKEMVNQAGFLNKGETILVKGSQNTLFLEEIVESLLVSKKDSNRLPRRENIWISAREKVYA